MVDDFRPYLTGVLHCGPPNPRRPRPTPVVLDPRGPRRPRPTPVIPDHDRGPTATPVAPETHTRHPRPRSGTSTTYHAVVPSKNRNPPPPSFRRRPEPRCGAWKPPNTDVRGENRNPPPPSFRRRPEPRCGAWKPPNTVVPSKNRNPPPPSFRRRPEPRCGAWKPPNTDVRGENRNPPPPSFRRRPEPRCGAWKPPNTDVRGENRNPPPPPPVFPAQAGTQVRGMESHATSFIPDPPQMSFRAKSRNLSRSCTIPTFPNGPPSVTPDHHREPATPPVIPDHTPVIPGPHSPSFPTLPKCHSERSRGI